MKLRVLISFIITFSLCFSTAANAYPVYYQCDKDRQMSEFVTGQELAKMLAPLLGKSKSEKEESIGALCAGEEECKRQLNQILTLAKLNLDIADDLQKTELAKISTDVSRSPAQSISQDQFELNRTIQETSLKIEACRRAILTISSDDMEFNGKDGKKVYMYFPYNNEYKYALHCSKYDPASKPFCNLPDSDDLTKAIRNAISAGVDPYVYLSIGLMENGSNGWDKLYLDPIGKMTATGCKEIPSDITKAAKGKLNSFENFHEMKAGVVTDDQKAKRLQEQLTTNGQNIIPGKTSYYCRDLTSAEGGFTSKAESKECCLKLNFTLQANQANKPSRMAVMESGAGMNPYSNSAGSIAEKTFLMDYLRDVQNSSSRGTNDPAFRLQSFNGFSKLMGGAESVPVFRSGVDFTKTPSYGYQSMDFIINSLASNAWIRKEVENQSKILKKKVPSILCQDVTVPGTFKIDSDYYFNKHKDSGRMESIKNKPWASMSKREKKVFTEELKYPKVHDRLVKQFPNLPSDLQNKKTIFKKTITDQNGNGIEIDDDPNSEKSIYIGKGEYKNQSSSLNEYEFIEKTIYGSPAAKKSIKVESHHLTTTATSLGGYPLDVKNDEFDGLNPFHLKKPVSIQFSDGSRYQIPEIKSTSDEGDITMVDELDSSGKSIKSVSWWSIIDKTYPNPDHEKISYQVTQSDGTGWSIEKSYAIQTSANALKGNNKLITLSDGTKWNFETKKQDAPAPVSNSAASMDEVTKFYFKDIYKDRNTISKASVNPWTPISDELVKEYGEAIREDGREDLKK